MKPVTMEIEIAGPPAVVWEYLANAEHNPEWLRNMSSCRWITDPPIRVGSRYEQVARFLGKEVRTCFEVSALEQGQLVTISSLPGSSFSLWVKSWRSHSSGVASRTRRDHTVCGCIL